jgi:signal peptidase II
MKRFHRVSLYIILFAVLTLLDRVTKTFILWHGDEEINVTSFLSFRLCKNRGISWGMLHSAEGARFFIVIVVTLLITCALVWYMCRRWKRGQSLVWETIALAGAVSNLFDRFVHNGVIDFITFSVGGWQFPSFNSADVCIVTGVLVMMLTYMKEEGGVRV